MRQRPTPNVVNALGKFDDPKTPLGAIVQSNLLPHEKRNLLEALSGQGGNQPNVLTQALQAHPQVPAQIQQALSDVLNNDFRGNQGTGFNNKAVQLVPAVQALWNGSPVNAGAIALPAPDWQSASNHLYNISQGMGEYAALAADAANGQPYPASRLSQPNEAKVAGDIQLYFKDLKDFIDSTNRSDGEKKAIYVAAVSQYAAAPAGDKFKFTPPSGITVTPAIKTQIENKLGRLQDYTAGKDRDLEEHFLPSNKSGATDNLALVANPIAQKFAQGLAVDIAKQQAEYYKGVAKKEAAKKDLEGYTDPATGKVVPGLNDLVEKEEKESIELRKKQKLKELEAKTAAQHADDNRGSEIPWKQAFTMGLVAGVGASFLLGPVGLAVGFGVFALRILPAIAEKGLAKIYDYERASAQRTAIALAAQLEEKQLELTQNKAKALEAKATVEKLGGAAPEEKEEKKGGAQGLGQLSAPFKETPSAALERDRQRTTSVGGGRSPF